MALANGPVHCKSGMITSTARGIGKAIAKQFAAMGDTGVQTPASDEALSAEQFLALEAASFVWGGNLNCGGGMLMNG